MLQKSNILLESSIWNVTSIFLKEPTQEHYLKEISKKARLAHTSVKKHLNELKKRSIIKESIEKKGKRKFPIFKANINSETYVMAKRHYNLHNHSFYGLIHYISLKLMPKNIILFGSYQQGRDIEESDIDIFVECKKQEINLKKYEIELNRKIQLHFKEHFKDLSKELKNNIINGVVLGGYLEVF